MSERTDKQGQEKQEDRQTSGSQKGANGGGRRDGGRSGDQRDVRPEHVQDKGRSVAEWTTLIASILVLLALVGLVIYDYLAHEISPPVIEVEPDLGMVRKEGDLYYLPVEVTNTGGQLAQNVEIELTLTPQDAEPESVGFSIQFLDRSETHDETLAFRTDPSQGEISHTISFTVP